VISFEGARTLSPIGSPLTYTCIVEGRAVWNFGENQVNTHIPTAAGNITNVLGIDGVNITDCTNSNGHHVSKLQLSSDLMQKLNSTDIRCRASKGLSFAAVGERAIPIQVFGKSPLQYAICSINKLSTCIL